MTLKKKGTFKILEIEMNKDRVHPSFKSKTKVNTLAIIQKLELETTIRLWKIQKKHLEKLFERIYTMKQSIKYNKL
jgi:hypothetical protein